MTDATARTSPLFPNYARADLAFERGEGIWLETADGRRFMDFSAGIAVSSLGHGHPHLVEALKAQAEKLWHVSNLFEIPDQRRMAERLVAATFADRAFFCNSGAEALECAIKTARRFHYDNGAPERTTILTVSGAFHGRTLATIAAGGQAKYLEGFGPKPEGFEQVDFDDHDALKAAARRDDTAAILIEPIQGEGGVRPVSGAWLRELRALCDECGILLIYDEVQTGIGRTGRLFAYEHSGAAPDILASAKGIGGGFPLALCLATAEVADVMQPGTHGTTYGGNPLAMAVGNAVLDVIMAEGFLEAVRDRALQLKQGLASLIDSYPGVVEDVRGEGLLIGVKCAVPNKDFVAALRDQGLLTAPAGDNVVRFLPPLIVSEDEVRDAIERADRAAATFPNANARMSA